MAVLLHHSQYQEPGADYEGGTHKVTISAFPVVVDAPCFHLDDNAEFIMDSVHLVGHSFSASIAEQHRSTNQLASVLAKLHLIAESLQGGTKSRQHLVTCQFIDAPGVDLSAEVQTASTNSLTQSGG